MKKKMNVIFIITDAQRADHLGCAGNPILKTPNLDRLASEGVALEATELIYQKIRLPLQKRFKKEVGILRLLEKYIINFGSALLSKKLNLLRVCLVGL